MGTNRPQVIIDLEEYNELLKLKDEVGENRLEIEPYERALSAIIMKAVRETGRWDTIREMCHYHGLSVSVVPKGDRDGLKVTIRNIKDAKG